MFAAAARSRAPAEGSRRDRQPPHQTPVFASIVFAYALPDKAIAPLVTATLTACKMLPAESTIPGNCSTLLDTSIWTGPCQVNGVETGLRENWYAQSDFGGSRERVGPDGVGNAGNGVQSPRGPRDHRDAEGRQYRRLCVPQLRAGPRSLCYPDRQFPARRKSWRWTQLLHDGPRCDLRDSRR